MQKIMFNDRYGLTQAVLEGKKTMTRRIIPIDLYNQTDWKAFADGDFEVVVDGEGYYHDIRNCGKYRVGEEVAVAQKYKDCWDIYQQQWEAKKDPFDWRTPDAILGDQVDRVKGWTNKMFVRADLMPHRIRITNIKVERLQDISEEDCLREGIQEYFPYIDRNPNDRVRTFQYFRDGKIRHRRWPASECFSLLIDDICGHGTWNRNPWVFAYEFELLK